MGVGAHAHDIKTWQPVAGAEYYGIQTAQAGAFVIKTIASGGNEGVQPAGNHTHTFTTSSTTGATATAFTNLPPYYALAFIMKL